MTLIQICLNQDRLTKMYSKNSLSNGLLNINCTMYSILSQHLVELHLYKNMHLVVACITLIILNHVHESCKMDEFLVYINFF